MTIGRERKRQISAGVHASIKGDLKRAELQNLAGLLAFANAVEPDFISTLSRKYSREAIRAIQPAGGEARLTAAQRD